MARVSKFTFNLKLYRQREDNYANDDAYKQGNNYTRVTQYFPPPRTR